MDEAQGWRELLGTILSDPQVKQRVVTELSLNPMTLTRWVTGESTPRPQNLRQLVMALPHYRESLIALIDREFPNFSTVHLREAGEGESAIIPSEFYLRVLQTRATTPHNLRYWVLCDLVLEQALKHLDPDRYGIGISIARCLPPATGKLVSSLLTDQGRGSPPWEQNMERETMLLGAESLAGYAVVAGHVVAIADLHAPGNRFPASEGAWERSAAATPLSFEGNMAGSLLVSSTQLDYFTPVRQQLISHYADLLALALEPDHFYEPRWIQLRIFPPQAEQRPYIAGFRQRLLGILRQAADRQQYISATQAEHLVWQHIEEELLRLPLAEAGR